jgi:hypothetical protein
MLPYLPVRHTLPMNSTTGPFLFGQVTSRSGCRVAVRSRFSTVEVARLSSSE